MNTYTRIFLVGEVNTGKTASLLTFPGEKIVQFYPGEGGHATIMDGTPHVQRVFLDQGSSPGGMSSQAIIEAVRKQTIEILTGKYGPVDTFCGDGVDKFYEHILNALSGGAYFKGEAVKDGGEDTLSAMVISRAEHWLFAYLNMVIESAVPYAVFTSWDKDKGERKASAGEHWSKVPTKRFPNLYGNAARNVLGKFSVVLHAGKGRLKDTDATIHYRWQTKMSKTIAAATIKGPVNLVTQIPMYVPQDWAALEPLLPGFAAPAASPTIAARETK